MPETASSESVLLDLETRQDEVLRQLDELNRRIEIALTESRLQIHIPDSADESAATLPHQPEAPARHSPHQPEASARDAGEPISNSASGTIAHPPPLLARPRTASRRLTAQIRRRYDSNTGS